MDTQRDMIEACAKTDESIKTGKINDETEVELLLIQFVEIKSINLNRESSIIKMMKKKPDGGNFFSGYY